jgi:thiamine-monophosphate kinase
MDESQKVSDLGEVELLRRIAARIPGSQGPEVWSGDDAAVLHSDEPEMLLTTDMMVQGLDFDLDYCTGGDLGYKAIAVNASDIAAMGGRPRHAVVAIALTLDTTVSFVDDFVDGALAACDRWAIGLAGGDVSGGGEISVSVAMTGAPVRTPAVLRSGAQIGDAICVTGSLGGAAAGLVALRRGLRSNGAVARLIDRHLRPTARVEEAALLAASGVTAMIDVSDGLAMDLGHLLEASRAGCRVDAGAIPVDTDIEALDGIDALEIAVIGGEDYELLLTMPPEAVGGAKGALERIGTPLTRIGTVSEDEPYVGPRSLQEWRDSGWQHLRGR